MSDWDNKISPENGPEPEQENWNMPTAQDEYKQMVTELNQLRTDNARLQAEVKTLPRTKDGVIGWLDRAWQIYGDEIRKLTIISIHGASYETQYGFYSICMCYSTREAAENARSKHE